MGTIRGLGLVALLSACGASTQPPPASVDAPVSAVSAAKVDLSLPPPDAPRVDHFPAGKGVTLLTDDFYDLTRDPRFIAKGTTPEEHIALARAAFGSEGEPASNSMFPDSLAWVALGPKSTGGPYSCQELLISTKNLMWTLRPADYHRCGLPYLADSTKQYRGNGPRWTVAKLRLMLFQIQGMDPLTAELTVRKQLGFPEGTSQPPEWTAIGPRGHDAPFTCHVLMLGTPAKVFEAPLERCGFAWPLPASRFDPGPPVPPLDKAALTTQCQQTCGQDMCMLLQKNTAGSSLRPEPDGLRARFADGRPTKTEITQSCLPIPPSCSPVTSSCFFTPPAPNTPPGTPNHGPCPKDDFGGFSYAGSPPHIECYGRYRAAP